MSFRYSCATVGRHAQAFLTSSSQTSSLRPLALGSARFIDHHHQTQIRLSSTSKFMTLTPPWQFENLPRIERRAFERWGPNYWEHMSAEDREFALAMAEKRNQKAAEFEEEFGSNWYAIMQEATAIKDEREMAERKETLHDNKEYRQAKFREKKSLRSQFNVDLKEGKGERLKQAMREVAHRRAKF